jgi:hypothetical protein
MKSKLMIAIAAMGIAVLFSSCAKVPQAEIDAATAAISEVKMLVLTCMFLKLIRL